MTLSMTLVRGIPGSGKSTIAKKLALSPNTLHIETDMYFTKNGEYCFDGSKLDDAHIWCKKMVVESLTLGYNVVVSNVFARNNEMKAYFKIASSFEIIPLVIEAKGKFKSAHNVPEEALKRNIGRWEELDLKYLLR